MKKTTLLPIFLSACFSGMSQVQISFQQQQQRYILKDSVYKHQVEYNEPGASGKNQAWDFSKSKTLDNRYFVKYFHPNTGDSTLICGLEHNTRYYYRVRQDSIWLTGFENHTTFLKYLQPELLIKYPLSYGDTFRSEWVGEGIYGNLFSLQITGKTTVQADAEGKLKLPGNNEIDSVLRVHTIKQYEETGKEKLRMTLDAYRWYSPHQHYPVFESIRTILHKNDKDTTLFSTSFYYLQKEDIATEVKKEMRDSVKNDKTPSEINKILMQVRTAPNPVKNELTIDYMLARRAQIQFALYNINGMPILRTNRRTLEEGKHTEVIAMSSLMTGTYVIHILVDDLVLSRVIIKQ